MAKLQKDVFFWFSLGKIRYLTQNHGLGFRVSKPSFSWEKVGFLVQNHLFPRKRIVFPRKPTFSWGEPKKNIFLEFGRIVSQKIFLWFFLGKGWCF